jgi:type II secretory pathway component PulM
MSELVSRWTALKTSERQIIVFGFTIITLAAIYFYAYQPYHNSIEHARQQIKNNQTDIQWLKEKRQLISQLKKHSGGGAVGQFTGSFINTVDQAIKQYRINAFVSLLENSGKDQVVVHFKKISFNRLITWAGYIKKRYGILVKHIDIQKEANELVNASIILKKS